MNNITPQLPVIRCLTLQDNPTIARIIHQVSTEYGLTADKGCIAVDPGLDELYQVYSQPGHAYWMIGYEGEVVGGSEIVLLVGSESDICELQKTYFLPAIHDKGLTKKLALMVTEQTRGMGFKHCYLGTAAFLREVIAPYEHLGFEHIDYTFGCTDHADCEVRMLRGL